MPVFVLNMILLFQAIQDLSSSNTTKPVQDKLIGLNISRERNYYQIFEVIGIFSVLTLIIYSFNENCQQLMDTSRFLHFFLTKTSMYSLKVFLDDKNIVFRYLYQRF
jgi:hypothetical protein